MLDNCGAPQLGPMADPPPDNGTQPFGPDIVKAPPESEKQKVHPFGGKLGHTIGKGQDSIVVDYQLPPSSHSPGLVIKRGHRGSSDFDPKKTEEELLYKKKKYELVKFFLGDFIPESHFVLGPYRRQDRIKGYTIQERVPGYSINDMSQEQQKDQRLQNNLHKLVSKLSNMFKIIEQVNEGIEEKSRIDVRLDLGGLSKIIEGQNYNIEDILASGVTKSPNLLVDPDTMNLFCIDFGSGTWSQEKEATMRRAVESAQLDPECMRIISS